MRELREKLKQKTSEKDKYRSLLRELLDAQRNRKSEQLSKDQLALFETLWKASHPEEEPEPAAKEEAKPEQPQRRSVSGDSRWRGIGVGTDYPRSGGIRETLRWLRQPSAADRRGDERRYEFIPA